MIDTYFTGIILPEGKARQAQLLRRALGKGGDGVAEFVQPHERAHFTYDKEHNLYICPRGKTLKPTGRLHSDNTFRYLVSKRDCDLRSLKRRCCPNAPSRKIPRDPNEEARDYTRSPMETEAYAL